MPKAVLTLLAAIAFAAGSLFTPEFGGFDPNRFPIPQENPPLQPVGFAFAIWFPIYAWLIASAIFGVAKRSETASWQDFRPSLVVSLIVGAPWLVVAKASPFWSTVMIWAMLISALIALRSAPRNDFAWARGAIGLYAGWLTAASAVGTSILLSGYDVLSQQTAAVSMLVVALGIALAVIFKTPTFNPTYGLAVQWALVGIIINSVNSSNRLMIVLASLGCAMVAAAIWKSRSNSRNA